MTCNRFGAVLTAVILLTAGCPARKEGTIKGTVTPPMHGVRIAALQGGAAAAAVEADSRDGSFALSLAPGAYDVSVSAPSSPFPLTFPGITVKPGEATTMPPILIAPSMGTSAISGKIAGAGNGAKVALLYEGKERAAARTDAQGKYEFKELPAGQYTVQIESPGYAADSAVVNLSDNQTASRDMRLLYVSAVDGVDWAAGKIRARGIGLPPRQAPTPTIRREMAKRAAVADAERNLLKIIEQIQVNATQKVIEALGPGTYVQRLQGYLQGHRIASERDLDGGRVEVELELPLTGPGGLSSYVPF